MIVISKSTVLAPLIDISDQPTVFVKRTSGYWSKGKIINKRSNSRVKTFLILLDNNKIKEVKYWVDGSYIWTIISDDKFNQLNNSWLGTINNDLFLKKLQE